MTRIAIVAVAMALALAGCATKYGEIGLTGGVTAQQMTADTWRIVARGNGYTDRSTVQDYALLKAAETTKASGGTHFVVLGADDATSAQRHYHPGTAHTTVTGRTAFTTYSPGYVSTVVKPGADFYIRVLHVPAGALPPPGAQNAGEIIRFIGSRVDRGKR